MTRIPKIVFAAVLLTAAATSCALSQTTERGSSQGLTWHQRVRQHYINVANHFHHRSTTSRSPETVVPYTCGPEVSARIVNKSLTLVTNNSGANAGFEILPNGSTTSFAPGVLSFTVSGAQSGDVFDLDVFNTSNAESGEGGLNLSNGTFTKDLSSLVPRQSG